MTRYFVDADGVYLGGFEVPEGHEPNWPADAIEVQAPPPDGRMRWVGGTWVSPVVPVTADDVRREASRRMQALVGARDAGHLEIVIANATREAVRLQNIRINGGTWTSEQATRAAELEVADAAIEEIRAASNAMEPAPPADFADDSHWPA